MDYGAMEYTYHLLAKECGIGIDMMPYHLLNEGKRRHFITERFDRKGNEKVHIQTLNGLEHVS
jgi:serine/threonine-protein kinase HipA